MFFIKKVFSWFVSNYRGILNRLNVGLNIVVISVIISIVVYILVSNYFVFFFKIC